MNESAIEWTDVTWNPVTDVRTHPDRLDQPLRMRKPKRIFVNSMSDLFHEAVPDDFIDQVWEVMINSLDIGHTFQILTKRPARMLSYLNVKDWPRAGEMDKHPISNVWLGVSVEDQATADERIPLLLQTPAHIRFLSCEPLLGAIDLFNIQMPDTGELLGPTLTSYGENAPIDWVIAGGESGPKARPSHPDWFRSLRDQCAAAGVPFLFKQWGEWEPRDEWSGHLGGGRFEPMLAIMPDGNECSHDQVPQDVGAQRMARVGKKVAGRMLDGVTHDEFPQ